MSILFDNLVIVLQQYCCILSQLVNFPRLHHQHRHHHNYKSDHNRLHPDAAEVEVDNHPSLFPLLLAARHTSAILLHTPPYSSIPLPANQQIFMMITMMIHRFDDNGENGDDDFNN